MPIQTGDIKLLKSQVLLDTTDGGGAMTSNEVIDGQSNNLFPDVSALDRTYGDVAMRKTFPAVQTNTNDSYYGSNVIVSRLPEDPRVNVSLFTTKDWVDRRSAARDKIERYLARGPKWAGHLLETQLEGQRAIQISLDTRDDEPKVGQGLTLVQFEGLQAEYEQYVRVTRVSSVVRVFSVEGKPVERKVCTIEITDPLRFDFLGQSVQDYLRDLKPNAFLRDTRVANAAIYYGATPLAIAAVLNDAAVTVDSIFTQLVPSATSETPLVDLDAVTINSLLRPAALANIVYSASIAIAPLASVYLGSPVMPGTLSLTAGSNVITDAAGVIKIGTTTVGDIDYEKGLLKFNAAAPSFTGVAQSNYLPAAKPKQVGDTASISITQDARGYNYTITLQPIPSPGTLAVSYTSQGNVYYLYDRGDGRLLGSDAAFGTGTVSYTTGSVIVTTGALPDADTELIFGWGRSTTTFARSDTVVEPSKIRLQLSKEQIAPGSLALAWTVNSVNKSAMDDGNGNITGDATGRIIYSSGVCLLQVSALLQKGAQITADYQWGAPNTYTQASVVPNGNGEYVIQLPNLGGAVVAKTVEMNFEVNIERAGATFTEVEVIPGRRPSWISD